MGIIGETSIENAELQRIQQRANNQLQTNLQNLRGLATQLNIDNQALGGTRDNTNPDQLLALLGEMESNNN